MKILVTGGAGFIGSYIVDELVQRGHTVRILDSLDPQVHPNGEAPDYLNPDAEFIHGDVRDYGALKNAVQDQEVIFHKAAAVGIGQSQYLIKHYVDVNTGGTANLMDILANSNHSVRKVVVPSSQSGYGEGCCECPQHGVIKPDLRPEAQLKDNRWEHECPHCGSVMKPVPTPESTPMDSRSIYAMTKRDQENIVMNIGWTYRIPSVALRYFNVYGPRQSLSNPYTGVMAIFISRLANGNPPVVYEDGLQTRDFISIHDVVDANMTVMESDAADYRILNLGTGIPTSIKAIADTIQEITGSSIESEIGKQFRKGDTRHCFADMTEIQKTLQFKPSVSLKAGLKEVGEWSMVQEKVDRFDEAASELSKRGLA